MNPRDSHGAAASQALVELRKELIDSILGSVIRAMPAAWERYTPSQRENTRKDIGYHLDYLGQTLRFGDRQLFSGYVEWLRSLFEGLGLPAGILPLTLQSLTEGMKAILPAEAATAACQVIEESSLALQSGQLRQPPTAHLGKNAGEYLASLLAGDRRRAAALAQNLVEGGLTIRELYLEVLQPSQYELGKLWMRGQISVAQEHFCTAATQSIMALFYPAIFSAPRMGKSLVAAGVGGELHELGLRMIADLLELEGWDSYYLGSNTPPEGIAAALLERSAPLLCLSATMAWHLETVEATIALVRRELPRERVAILVGGAVFNSSEGLWRRLGADGYAADATSALLVAESLLASTRRQ